MISDFFSFAPWSAWYVLGWVGFAFLLGYLGESIDQENTVLSRAPEWLGVLGMIAIVWLGMPAAFLLGLHGAVNITAVLLPSDPGSIMMTICVSVLFVFLGVVLYVYLRHHDP